MYIFSIHICTFGYKQLNNKLMTYLNRPMQGSYI